MRDSLIALRNLGLGLAFAMTIAMFVPNTVSATTCSTQCECILLICSSDNCGSGGGGASCNSSGCSWWCYDPMWAESYYCRDYCI